MCMSASTLLQSCVRPGRGRGRLLAGAGGGAAVSPGVVGRKTCTVLSSSAVLSMLCLICLSQYSGVL
jgi:hypothetical protein